MTTPRPQSRRPRAGCNPPPDETRWAEARRGGAGCARRGVGSVPTPRRRCLRRARRAVRSRSGRGPSAPARRSSAASPTRSARRLTGRQTRDAPCRPNGGAYSRWSCPSTVRRATRHRASERKVGPCATSSAGWSAPLDTESSQTRTSPRSFIVLLQVGLPLTGPRCRPRQDGYISVSSGHRGKVAPRGDTGGDKCGTEGFAGVRCGRSPDHASARKRLHRRRERKTTAMPEEGLEPPTRGL